MSRRLDTVLLPAGSLTGSGEHTPLARSEHFTAEVIWGVNVTSGVVAVETGPHKGYPGAWTQQAEFTIGSGSVANSIDSWRGTGPFGAIRIRITTTINGEGAQGVLHEN